MAPGGETKECLFEAVAAGGQDIEGTGPDEASAVDEHDIVDTLLQLAEGMAGNQNCATGIGELT